MSRLVTLRNMTVDDAGALRLHRKAGMEPRPAFTVWSKAGAT
jgi:hypothetical protein